MDKQIGTEGYLTSKEIKKIKYTHLIHEKYPHNLTKLKVKTTIILSQGEEGY